MNQEPLKQLYQRLACDTAALLAHPNTPRAARKWINRTATREIYPLTQVTPDSPTSDATSEPYLDVAERFGLTVAECLGYEDLPEDLWEALDELGLNDIPALLTPQSYPTAARLRGIVTEFAKARRAEETKGN